MKFNYLVNVIFEQAGEPFLMEIVFEDLASAEFYIKNILGEITGYIDGYARFIYGSKGNQKTFKDYVQYVDKDDICGVLIAYKGRYIYKEIIDPEICEEFITVK